MGTLKLNWQHARDFSLLIFTVVPGVIGLSGWSHGTARIVQMLVAASCAFFLLLRFTYWYLVVRNAALRGELARTEAELKALRKAIGRVVDRQKPLYEKSVEIAVVVGDGDDGDRVTERVETTPKPQFLHCGVQPIVPDGTRIDDPREINFSCKVERGGNGSAKVTVVPISVDDDPLYLWLVFEPGISSPVTWVMEYQPKGLWRPLRESGIDTLRWSDRSIQNSGGTPSLARLAVHFIFPDGARAGVQERRGRGTVEPGGQAVPGKCVVTWRDEAPALGVKYVWDVTMDHARE